MTELDWERFESLPGDQAANFELLWRGAIRQSYGRYGTFRARAQQPGVEFHLELDRDCALGDAGQHFGWQTKWWPRALTGRSIGAGRKRDVEDSLEKTQAHLPGLTDWVLCTYRPLAPIDEDWWNGLSPDFKLDHQVAADLANLLTGDAELLRETYFGDLILTPERLESINTVALADVRERWFPDVHQTSAAEVELRRMLAEPGAWEHLNVVESDISNLMAIIRSDVSASPIEATIQAELDGLLETVEIIRQLLADAYARLTPGGDHTWREIGEASVPPAPSRTPKVLRKLRAANHPAALACSNLIVHTRTAATLVQGILGEVSVRCITVAGDAGYGKTQLAARIASATEFRPAGVLLYGRQLRSRDGLDDLARRISVRGKAIETFESLLAAVDAAAARAQCRLPIVIDGLNEAEDPSDWKQLLERAQVLLKDYPSVLLICTLRSAFLPRAIPSSMAPPLNLDGFGDDTAQAIARYFEHFNIDADGIDLPLERFNHPIALRIFCSVTNPTREHRVRLSGRATSLNAMFEEYLADSARRIETLTASRIRADEVRHALRMLGVEMWQSDAREVTEQRAKELFGDLSRPWGESILYALQEEGVLIRQTAQLDESVTGGSNQSSSHGTGLMVSVVYDLLAGHVVATAMAESNGALFAISLSTPAVAGKFSGATAEAHPLAVDIFNALVFVLPRRGLGQLWERVPKPLLFAALLRTTELAAEDIDSATVAAWQEHSPALVLQKDIWARLRSVRAVPNHPLNANFADKLLRSMRVANRDLTWTEWLRDPGWHFGIQPAGRGARAIADIRLWTKRWQESDNRTEADALRARWFTWTLTSTVRDLRDAATAALYWYGRADAGSLFDLAVSALNIDDQYIAERVVAAAYGVATAHQQPDDLFGDNLATYLREVVSATVGINATAPTYHRLIRYYIAGTVQFARIHYPAAVPTDIVNGIKFADGRLAMSLPKGDARREEVASTIQMDFGNYTLGRLFEDRSNYDNKHPGHRDATDQILGIVYELGWRKNDFSSIDSGIGNVSRGSGSGRVERYGKKYSWIGFYLVSGALSASGKRVHWLEVDIDPTFPQESPQLPFAIPSWAQPIPSDERDWLVNGVITVPDDLMYTETLVGSEGPWVLVHAELSTKDEKSGRGGFGLFNTLALSPHDLDTLVTWWSTKDHPGRDLIDLPSAYYVFAGEIPWHDRMVTSGDDILGTGTPPIERDESDSWVDPHDNEDPYIDRIRIDAAAEKNDIHTEVSSNEHSLDLLDKTQEPRPGEELDYAAFLGGVLDSRRAQLRPYVELESESMAHAFAWEGHNSSENQVFAYVPSQRLSKHASLHSVAAGFDQVDVSGRPGSMSFAAPAGFDGHLLYIREDIVKAYAGARAVVTFGWGERQIDTTWPEKLPESLLAVYRTHRNVWRTHRVVTDEDHES